MPIAVSFVYDQHDETIVERLEVLFREKGLQTYRLSSLNSREATYDYDLRKEIKNSSCLLFLKTQKSSRGPRTPALNKQLRVAKEERKTIFVFIEFNECDPAATDPALEDGELRALTASCPQIVANQRPLEPHFHEAVRRVLRFLLTGDDAEGVELAALRNELTALSSSHDTMATSVTALTHDLVSANRKFQKLRVWSWGLGLLLLVVLAVLVGLRVWDHYHPGQAGAELARVKASHEKTRAALAAEQQDHKTTSGALDRAREEVKDQTKLASQEKARRERAEALERHLSTQLAETGLAAEVLLGQATQETAAERASLKADQEKLAAEQQAHKAAEEKLAAEQQDHKTAEEKIAAEQRAHKAAEEKLAAARQAQDQTKRENQKLARDWKEQKENLDAVTKEYARLVGDKTSLNNQLTKAQEDLKEVADARNRLQGELSELKKKENQPKLAAEENNQPRPKDVV